MLAASFKGFVCLSFILCEIRGLINKRGEITNQKSFRCGPKKFVEIACRKLALRWEELTFLRNASIWRQFVNKKDVFQMSPKEENLQGDITNIR